MLTAPIQKQMTGKAVRGEKQDLCTAFLTPFGNVSEGTTSKKELNLTYSVLKNACAPLAASAADSKVCCPPAQLSGLFF